MYEVHEKEKDPPSQSFEVPVLVDGISCDCDTSRINSSASITFSSSYLLPTNCSEIGASRNFSASSRTYRNSMVSQIPPSVFSKEKEKKRKKKTSEVQKTHINHNYTYPSRFSADNPLPSHLLPEDISTPWETREKDSRVNSIDWCNSNIWPCGTYKTMTWHLGLVLFSVVVPVSNNQNVT